MTDTQESLADSLRQALDEVKDIDSFRDPKFKRNFLDEVQKKTEGKKNSIDATFSALFKQRLKTENKEISDFSKKAPKKYNSKLDISIQDKPVELNDKLDLPAAQNPKAQLSSDGTKMTEYPLTPIAGSIDIFFTSMIDNLEPLTKDEKEDAGMCLNMCLGNILSQSEKARIVFGLSGLIGIYGGRIRKARKITKSKKKKEIAKKQDSEPMPAITQQDEEKFNENSTNYLTEKMVTDT